MPETNYYCSRCNGAYKWGQMTSTPKGTLFCPNCWKQLNNEVKRKCPVDGIEMQKHLISDVALIDTCSKCGGTWLDKGEVELLKKRDADENWSKGYFWGMLLG